MTWNNEKHMRETIRLRRGLCADLRKAGHKWHEIAELLSYGSAQHARIDWLRMKRPAKNQQEKTRAAIDASGRNALTSLHRRLTTSP